MLGFAAVAVVNLLGLAAVAVVNVLGLAAVAVVNVLGLLTGSCDKAEEVFCLVVEESACDCSVTTASCA